MKKSVYQVINDKILEQLEKGVIPWRQPWKAGSADTARNLTTDREYSGINRWLLNCLGYVDNYYLTYKQAKKLGGNVIKGSQGFPVIYWNWIEREDPETGEVKTIPFLRYYTVFNLAQCENIPDDKIPARVEFEPLNFDPVSECEKILNSFKDKPLITHGAPAASYSPGADRVEMPAREVFNTVPDYYDTLFHELAHSTGHKSRLNRDLSGFLGNTSYACEELVAEFTASFLCGVAGIDRTILENQAAYIAGWKARIKDPKNQRILVIAAAQAEKAADYIRGKTERAVNPFEAAA